MYFLVSCQHMKLWTGEEDSMSSNRLNKQSEKEAGMFVLKSYLFYLRRFPGSYSPKQIFFPSDYSLSVFQYFFFSQAVYIFQIVTSLLQCHLEYILPLLSDCSALITSLFVKWEGPFLNCQQTELVQSNTLNFPAFQPVQPVIQLRSCLQKDINLHFFHDLM